MEVSCRSFDDYHNHYDGGGGSQSASITGLSAVRDLVKSLDSYCIDIEGPSAIW